MKQHTLRGALPILAKFLGRKLGVHVIVGGDQARTDGQTIILPALPENDTAHILAHGYLDHEGAHVRYTDFSAADLPTPLGRALLNILEDVRIEKALGAALPGSRQNLERLVTHLVAQGDFWQVPDPQAHPAQQVQAYLLFRLRADVLGQTALSPLADRAEALLRQTLPVGTMTRLAALAFEVGNAHSTREVRDLAERILQMLEEEQRQAEAPPASSSKEDPGGDPTADEDSTSQGQSGDGGHSGSPGEDGEALAASSSAPAEAGGVDPEATATADPDPEMPLNPNSDLPADGDAEVLHRLLDADPAEVDASLGDLGRQLEAQLNRTAAEADAAPVMAEFDPLPWALGSAVLSHRVRAATVALRRRLAGLVEAERRDAVRRVRQGRHLACRQLYRLRCRETGVFVKKTRLPAPDTALYLLLDRSVSMAGDRLQVASEAALATALALEEIPGCQTAVLAFPGSTEARVMPLLDFGERVSSVAGRFRIAAQGSTPMTNALWRAAYGVLRRPEPRRLLVVITDGQPDHPQATRDIIQRCRQAGIEVFGLGIMLDDPVKALFGTPWAVSIADLDALPATLFGLLERGLLAA